MQVTIKKFRKLFRKFCNLNLLYLLHTQVFGLTANNNNRFQRTSVVWEQLMHITDRWKSDLNRRITGSALALHCCKAHAKINGKIENLTPCKIVTHEDFNGDWSGEGLVFARNRDTAVPAEGNGNFQTLICVLVARPRRCLTLSKAVPWQNWVATYLGYTLRMKTLFCGWPVMAHEMHTRRSILLHQGCFDCETSQSVESHICSRWQLHLEKWWPNFWHVAHLRGQGCISLLWLVNSPYQSLTVVVDN